MGRAVGIELTFSSARILCLEQAGKETRILQFHEAPIPNDAERPWDQRAALTLKEAIAQARIPRGRVVCALDSGDAILREVTLPFKNEDQIRKTVRFEMESLIHNYTIEQLIVSHYKTGETDKGSHLLAAAVPKTVVGDRLRLYREAGVDPSALDLDVCAVFSAMLHAGAIDTDETILLVYGTPKFTKLVLIEKRRPRSIRTIRFTLSTAPQPAPAAAPQAAPAAQPEGNAPEGGEFEPLVVLSESDERRFRDLDPEVQDSLIGILSKEISRFLLASAASTLPAHILLSGSFEDREAADQLESATEIPVRTFNLAEALGADPSLQVHSASMAASLGLALKGIGIDPLGMDFRQDEFQYRRKFDAIKNTLFVTAQLVVVALLAVALHFYLRKSDAERDRKSVLNHQQALCENVTGQTLPDASLAFSRLAQLARQYEGIVDKDLPLRASAREAWRDLFGALDSLQRRYGNQKLGDAELLVILESFDVQQSTIPGSETLTMTLKGHIRNLEYAGALRTEIRTKELFRNAEWVGQLVPGEDGLYLFNLRSTSGKGK